MHGFLFYFYFLVLLGSAETNHFVDKKEIKSANYGELSFLKNENLNLRPPTFRGFKTTNTESENVVFESFLKSFLFLFLFLLAMKKKKKNQELELQKKAYILSVPPAESKKLNLSQYSRKDPLKVRLIKNSLLNKKGDSNALVFSHGNSLSFSEGQCVGVLVPKAGVKQTQQKVDKNTGKNAEIRGKGGDAYGWSVSNSGSKDEFEKLRLYSISCSSSGEDKNLETVSLCVKRSGKVSNILCDLHEGDEIFLTGPLGKEMLLPAQLEKWKLFGGQKSSKNEKILMISTGTGIAPFRAFLKKFEQISEKIHFKASKKGKKEFPPIWLIFGTADEDSLLYQEEIKKWKNSKNIFFSENVKISVVFSRSRNFPKTYVQDVLLNPFIDHFPAQKVQKSSGNDELFASKERRGPDILKEFVERGFVYLCGKRGMKEGVEGVMRGLYGEEWGEKRRKMKKEKRWCVEVY